MEPFDPAINYGPNDAGVSALSIIFIVIALIAGSWVIGNIYSKVKGLFNKDINNNGQR